MLGASAKIFFRSKQQDVGGMDHASALYSAPLLGRSLSLWDHLRQMAAIGRLMATLNGDSYKQ